MGIDTRGLERCISPGPSLLLDTSMIIAYLNGGEAISPVSSLIIDSWVKSGRNIAVLSMITVMEVLVKPMKQQTGIVEARDFLARFPNLQPHAIDMEVAVEAASLRAQYGFKPPDALIIATGIVHKSQHLLTNDTQWLQKLAGLQAKIRVVHLSKFA